MSDATVLDRRRFLGGAAMTIAASRLGVLGAALQQIGCGTPTLAAGTELSSLSDATAWINSPALTSAGLRGRVVLVDFGTYTCINWLRTLPYVRAWHRRYRDRGLVLIGAHTPEFSFEHDLANVRRAVAGLRIEHPIAVDNDYAIWRAFENHYWPAVYLVDAQGRVRYRHFGEGEYDKTEAAVRRALADAGGGEVGPAVAAVEARGVEVQADWGSLKTPETYVGAGRTANFASPGGLAVDERRGYAIPPRLARNEWALAGEWTAGTESAVLDRADGRISYRFHARDLHVVMGPVSPGTSVRFRVRLDGRPPDAAHGIDVDAAGAGTVDEQRMYQLLRQPGRIGDRTFEIEFLDPGVAVFAFTFG
jgi:hypothetical protein